MVSLRHSGGGGGLYWFLARVSSSSDPSRAEEMRAAPVPHQRGPGRREEQREGCLHDERGGHRAPCLVSPFSAAVRLPTCLTTVGRLGEDRRGGHRTGLGRNWAGLSQRQTARYKTRQEKLVEAQFHSKLDNQKYFRKN